MDGSPGQQRRCHLPVLRRTGTSEARRFRSRSCRQAARHPDRAARGADVGGPHGRASSRRPGRDRSSGRTTDGPQHRRQAVNTGGPSCGLRRAIPWVGDSLPRPTADCSADARIDRPFQRRVGRGCITPGRGCSSPLRASAGSHYGRCDRLTPHAAAGRATPAVRPDQRSETLPVAILPAGCSPPRPGCTRC